MNYLLDFINSSSIFLIPLLLGSSWRGTLVARFLRGSLLLFACYFLAFSLESFVSFTLVLQGLVWLGVVTGLLRSVLRRDDKTILQHVRKGKLIDVITVCFLLVLSGYAFFWLFKALTPYPYTLNWDTFEHITLATKLLSGQVSLFPSQLTDTFTFNGYSPLFHMLLSLPTLLFGASLIGTYYYAEWWFYLIVVGVSMWAAYKFLPHRLSMLLAGIFAIFGFASTVVYLPFFFLPQTLAATASIALLFSKKTVTNRGVASLLLLAIPILLIHYVIGFVGVGLILLWTMYEHLIAEESQYLTRYFWVITTGSVGTVIFSLLLHMTGGFQLTGREEAQYYQFTLSQLGHFFLQWYGVMGGILLLLGAFFSLRTNDTRLKGMFLLSLPLFALSFSPLSYTLKFFVLGWYFLLLLFTLALTRILLLISPKLRFIGVGMVIITALLVYYPNQTQYKFYLYDHGRESHFSPEELEAASFLKNQGEHTFIISDPATQGVLEALGEVNSQGGVYMDSTSRTFLSKLKEAPAIDDPIILANITDLLPVEAQQTKKRFFVASGRYFQWQLFSPAQKESVFFNIWHPYTLSQEDREKITAMKATGMKEVYHNSEMSIFEL